VTSNQRAFLSMIAHSEGTDRALDPYRVCYGYRHTIVSLRDHPAVTGEWRGESLANLGPQYAHEISTAAGRYQINRPTWMQCKAALDLKDFTGPSQDDAALFLIKQCGYLDAVNAGDIQAAIQGCSPIWASLPGSAAGQPTRSLASLVDAYTELGGELA
jgi:muramidase (phage lysozyme)